MFDTSLGLSEDAVLGVYPKQSSKPGEDIVPLGFRKNGAPIWPMMGGAPDADDDFDGDDDTEDEDEDDDDNDDDGDDSDDDDDDDDQDDNPEGKSKKKKSDEKKPRTLEEAERKIAAQQDNLDRFHRVVRKARQERDDALKELGELKEKGTTDETLKSELKKSETRINKLNEDLQSARLANAFLSDNSYEWVNPGQALKLVDLSDVEIDEDGKVVGLKAALEALADSSPHLLKPRRGRRSSENSNGNNNGGGNGGNGGTTRTGQPPRNGRKGQAAKKKRDDEIAAKYRIGG